MSDADVIVAGGGLAGSAAAIRLAEAGRRVLVAEKSAGPHDKVCGEFLSGEALAMLAGLGINVPALGGVPITHLGLPRRRRLAVIALPFDAASLSRRILDEALLARAKALGVTVLRGAAVREIAADGGLHRVRLDGGVVLAAPDVLVATGKHDLRGHGRPEGPHAGLVGFKMHYDTTPEALAALAKRTDLLGLDGGYAGLQPVAEDRFNLCFLAPDARVRSHGFQGIVEEITRRHPAAAALMASATPAFSRPLAVYRVPYGYVRRTAGSLRFIGDQAAVIPSFTGDGMAIALWTGGAAAASILSGEAPATFQARIADVLAGQIGRATRLSKLLVNPIVQEAAAAVMALAPSLARAAARSTRLPAAALAG